jgi:hypothetical protein
MINWDFKHKKVGEIIEKTKLRPNNILFIDDNHLNLENIKYHYPELSVVMPEFIPNILIHPAFSGKNDENHSRLQQYKMLETKAVAQESLTDNETFLRSCNIQVQVFNVDEGNFERVLELVNRTNQLNFTKIRFKNSEGFKKILNNENYENKCISAKDNFGNYGIIGFYCLDKTKNELLHYLFSCRVLNLGIEQYFYSKLKFPIINATADTAVRLNEVQQPDWIDLIVNRPQVIHQEKCEVVKSDNTTTIHLIGACDLQQILGYLSNNSEYQFIENFVRTSITNHSLRHDNIECLKNAKNLDEKTLKKLVDKLPLLEMSMFKKDVFQMNYDVLFYSVLTDYCQVIYEEKATGIKINYSLGYLDNVEDKNHHPAIINYFKERVIYDIDENFLEMFRNEFTYLGQISADEFKENLKWLRANISQPIVFINGAEIAGEFEAEPNPKLYEQHCLLNKVLDEFVNNNENTYLLDVRKFVKKREDCTNVLRHYIRPVYKMLADDLNTILKNI